MQTLQNLLLLWAVLNCGNTFTDGWLLVDCYAAEYCVAKGFIDDSSVKVMTITGGYFKLQRQLKIIVSDKRPTISDDFLRHDRGHLPVVASNRRKWSFKNRRYKSAANSQKIYVVRIE